MNNSWVETTNSKSNKAFGFYGGISSKGKLMMYGDDDDKVETVVKGKKVLRRRSSQRIITTDVLTQMIRGEIGVEGEIGVDYIIPLPESNVVKISCVVNSPHVGEYKNALAIVQSELDEENEWIEEQLQLCNEVTVD